MSNPNYESPPDIIKNRNAAFTSRTFMSFDKWVTIDITATNTITEKENNKAAKKKVKDENN